MASGEAPRCADCVFCFPLRDEEVAELLDDGDMESLADMGLMACKVVRNDVRLANGRKALCEWGVADG